MRRTTLALAALVAGAVGLAGCGGGTEMPMGPGPMGPGRGPGNMTPGTPSFVSVSPGGGSMGVSVGTGLTLRWGTAMGPGMEQFVDLHRGDLTGAIVPMNCAWSSDRTLLECTPQGPLEPMANYTIHVGGGMVDHSGQLVDVGHHGPGYGGRWVTGPLVGAGHGGAPWGALGPGWRHQGGSYGMAFAFMTA